MLHVADAYEQVRGPAPLAGHPLVWHGTGPGGLAYGEAPPQGERGSHFLKRIISVKIGV